MRLDKLPKTLFIAIFSIFLFVPFVQASPPMCSGTFTLTCTKWENFITGYTCTPPNLVGCYRAHSVSGATDCTIYAGACVPNLAGTLGSMTCSYPYFADVMSNNCSFEPCPDGNPPVNGQCGYVPPHDDPPPPVVFGCNNCTEVYLPTGCSTDPNNANYDPTCHFDHMDCAGHPPGPAPVCHATRQWCDPDNLCIGGPSGLGLSNYVNRQFAPIASGFGLVSGHEKRFCDNQCGTNPSPSGGINDPCLIGINSGVTCSIIRVGSNNGYSGNSNAYSDAPSCYNSGVGPNNPATFEVSCYSGANQLDNANWQLVSLTSSLGGDINHNFPGGSSVAITFRVNITYPNDSLTGTDSISVQVSDGGSAYISQCGPGYSNIGPCNANQPGQGLQSAKLSNIVSITQQVDTVRPTISRTSDFKITDTSCFNNLPTDTCDPNTILGSGKLQVDYKAFDVSGIAQHTAFAGPINFTNPTISYQFLAEWKASATIGTAANNYVNKFNYFHYNGAVDIGTQTIEEAYDQIYENDINIKPNYISASDNQYMKYVSSGTSYVNDYISVLYKLSSPQNQTNQPIYFRWGPGAENNVYNWQSVDMFCNQVVAEDGNRFSNILSIGNPWANIINGNSFVKNGVSYYLPKSIIQQYGNPENAYHTTYIARNESDDKIADNSKTSMAFMSNGESLLDVYKFTKGRYESLYDYFKNLFGTVNRYDKRSEIYCGNDSNKSLYLTTDSNYNDVWIFNQDIEGYLMNGSDGNGHQTWLDSPSSTLIRDVECMSNAKAIVVEVNGNLQMRNHNDERNSPIYASTKPIIFLVDGNLTIDENIEKRNGNTIMFVVKGDVIVYGGKSRSMFDSKTVTQEPSSDTIDATFFVDGKFITMPDDGESHNINGVDYNGQTQFVADYPDMYPNVADGETVIWDSLKIKGSVIVSGLCPNERSAPIYNADGTLRQTGIECKSHFGRDLILVQNLLYPAESITYDPAYLFDFKNLLKGVPPFNIRETGYDPFL